MKIDAHLPKIKCPVYGVLKAYSLSVADKENSKELKYVLIGVWNDSFDAKEVTVYGIYVDTENPEYISILYTENDGDGVMRITRANDIKPIEEQKEAPVDDTLRAYHYGNKLFIRKAKQRTFRFMAEGLSRVIRGSASYILYNVGQQNDGTLLFQVANVNKPQELFEISAKKLTAGAWHCEKGKRCPVPGPAPDEEAQLP